ncbi:MAG: PPC domain-containing DNA-binding protein [Candidatus Nanohaloarchaea archaeon]
MDYVHKDGRIIARLDPGDKVIKKIRELREKEDIENGFFYGIGAVDEVTLGHYDVEEQDYREKEFEQQFEVTSFSGNISPDKVHAHIQLGKRDFSSIGGHCSSAKVSGTFEIIIFLGETPLEHELDERTGLDVFDL